MLVEQKDNPIVNQIVKATFPNNHKPVEIREFCGPVRMNSYWDSGSKDEFALYDTISLKVYEVPTSHPFFDRKSNGDRVGNIELKELPPHCVLAKGGYFMGKPSRVTLYFHEDNLIELIPFEDELEFSEEEKKAAAIICGIKGGPYRKEYFEKERLGEFNQENPHIKKLVSHSLVKINKAGAIQATTECRNKVANWGVRVY